MRVQSFVKYVMGKYDLNQMAVAVRCGVSQATVNKIINFDGEVSIETAQKIADAFGVPLYIVNSDGGSAFQSAREIEHELADLSSAERDEVLSHIRKVKQVRAK